MKKYLLSFSIIVFLASINCRYSTAQNIIYAEDFDSTINGAQIPAGWQNILISGPRTWEWHTGPTQGPSLAEFDPECDQSTSCNGFIYYDSDANDSVSGVTIEEADIISPRIDCSLDSVVYLKFNEWFWLWNDPNEADSCHAILYISSDGITWTDLYHAEAGLQQDQFIPNPTAYSINITPYAAHQDTVYLKWKWIGDWGYYWMIDDIQVVEPAPNDVGVSSINTPSTSCSLSDNEDISVTIENHGLNAASGFWVNVEVNGVIGAADSIGDTIQPGQTYDLTFSTPFDFSSQAQYDITAWTGLNGDGIMDNDSAHLTIYQVIPETIDSTPTLMGFEPADSFFYGWTIEDVNNDGIAWHVTDEDADSGSYSIRNGYNAVLPADDWFYSTCLNLDSGQQYVLEFDYKVYDSTTAERLAVSLGDMPDHTVMDNVIHDFGEITNSNWVHAAIPFDVTSPGVNYLGWHAYSDTNAWWIYIDNISIKTAPPVADFNGYNSFTGFAVFSPFSDTGWTWCDAQTTFYSLSTNSPSSNSWTFSDTTDVLGDTVVHPGRPMFAQYTVCLTSTNGSGSDTKCKLVTVTCEGVEALDVPVAIIYPNPASDILQLQFSQPLNDGADLSVSNLIGETILLQRLSVGDQQKAIDVRALPNGIYFLSINTVGQTFVMKFTIDH